MNNIESVFPSSMERWRVLIKCWWNNNGGVIDHNKVFRELFVVADCTMSRVVHKCNRLVAGRDVGFFFGQTKHEFQDFDNISLFECNFFDDYVYRHGVEGLAMAMCYLTDEVYDIFNLFPGRLSKIKVCFTPRDTDGFYDFSDQKAFSKTLTEKGK